MPGYAASKDNDLKRLDASRSVALGLLEEHLTGCMADAATVGGAEADRRVREAAIARPVRT